MPRNLILVVCLSMLLAGCNVSVGYSDGSSLGYSYVIHGPGGDSVGYAAEFAVVQDGISVNMDDGELTVNGRSYGQIAAGASIEVERDRVLVNGVEVQPE
jgi:hypothetical protein